MKTFFFKKTTAFLFLFSTILTPSFAQTAGNPPTWQWAKSMGGSGNDQCNDVVCDASGNVYMVGTFNGQFNPGSGMLQSDGQNNGFLVKLSPDGNALWSKQLKSNSPDGEVFCQSLTLDNSGNVLVAGTFKFGNLVAGATEMPLLGNIDAFLAKFDANGNQLWVKTKGDAGVSYQVKSLAADNSGQTFLYGWPNILKYSSDGSLLLNIPNPSVSALSGGDIYWIGGKLFIAGFFKNTLILGNTTLNASNGALYSCEIDPTNGSLFNGAKFLEGTNTLFNFVLNDLFVNAAGELYAAGSVRGAFSSGNCVGAINDARLKSMLIKIDANGCAWIKNENGVASNENNIQRITQLADGTMWFSGERTSSSGVQFDGQSLNDTQTGFLLKLDPVSGDVLALQESFAGKGLANNGLQIFVAGLKGTSAILDKRNNDGSVVFEKIFSNDGGFVNFASLESDGSGIYFSATVFGKISVANTVLDIPQTSLLIGKLSLDGTQLLWHNLIAGTQAVYRPLGAISGTLDQNAGRFYVSGLYLNQFSFNGQSIDPPAMDETGYFVVQFDLNGNPGWLKTMPGVGYLSNISHDYDQKLLVCGTFSNSLSLGSFTLQSKGNDDFFIAKIDISGNILWAKRGGGEDVEFTVMASTDAQNNIYLAAEAYSLNLEIEDQGTLNTNEGDGNVLLAKLSPDGAVQWLKLYGGDANLSNEPRSFPMAIQSDPSGNIYLSGYYGRNNTFGNITLTSSYGYNNFVGKFNSSGDPLWLTPIRTKRSSVNYHEIGLDAQGNLYYTSILTDSIFVGGTVLARKIGGNTYAAFFSRFDGQTGDLDWLKAAASSPECLVFPTSMSVLGVDKLICGGTFVDRLQLDNYSLNGNSGSNGFIGLLSKSNSITAYPDTATNLIQLSPNPAHDLVNLTGHVEQGVEVYLTNSQGAVVLRQEILALNAQYPLNIKQLPAGIYYLTTISGGRLETSKLVIY
jgi:hypothetical protein